MCLVGHQLTLCQPCYEGSLCASTMDLLASCHLRLPGLYQEQHRFPLMLERLKAVYGTTLEAGNARMPDHFDLQVTLSYGDHAIVCVSAWAG